MDFSKRHTFAGIDFKPTKNGTVRWRTVKKILETGQVECLWYIYDSSGGGETVEPSRSVLMIADRTSPDRCYLSDNGPTHNPRYSNQRFIHVRFHSNSYVTIYDLADLPELADGTEVEECEACVGCDTVAEDPPALVEKGGLRLVWSAE